MTEATQENLDAALAKWQQRLRLTEWEIQASLVHHAETDGFAAHVEPWMQFKRAKIRLVYPTEYPADDMTHANDWEEGLVHELLEILLYPFAPKEEDRLAYDAKEFLCNCVAEALVTLDRKKNECDAA